jgi:hypothetical protein
MTPRIVGGVWVWPANESVNRPPIKIAVRNAVRVEFTLVQRLAGGSPPLNGEEFTFMSRGGVLRRLRLYKFGLRGNFKNGSRTSRTKT